MSTLSVHLSLEDNPAPVYSANARTRHDAAGTIKIGVLAALRGHDPDTPIAVTDTFPSRIPGGSFTVDAGADSDPLPWGLLGNEATLGWLAERMITHSSSLATNLCAHHAGLAVVADTWRATGLTSPGMRRLVEDYEARRAGIHNAVTAVDLAWMLRSLHPAELGLLTRNAYRDDLAAGLPDGTWIAAKNGWAPGARHCVALIRPDDAPAYVLAVCYSGALANGDARQDPAARLLARLSTTFWERRNRPEFACASTEN